MIVRDRPNPIALLIALRGSVVPDILPHILLVALLHGDVGDIAGDRAVDPAQFPQ